MRALHVVNYALRFSIFIGVIIATGCGTIGGRTRHVSVDSTPRGVNVVDASGRHLGVTPFFAELTLASEWTLSHRQAWLQKRQTHLECRFRWVTTPLENLPLALMGGSAGGGPLALAVWAAAVTTDTLTGAAYQCPERIRILDVETAERVKYCPTYYVMDPIEVHPQYRKQLRNNFMQTMNTKIGCLKTAHIDNASTWLRRLDVNLADAGSFEANRRRFHRLGYESGASHIAQIALTDDDQQARIKVRVLDLHRLKVVQNQTYPLPSGLKKQDIVKGRWGRRLARWGLELIPDSLAAGVNRRVITTDEESTTDDGGRVSPTFRLMSLSHPDAYETWAFVPRLSPGLGLDLVQGVAVRSDRSPTNNFSRLALTAMGSITLHSPIGAFEVGIGYGYGYYFYQGPAFRGDSGHGSEVSAQLTYTVFMTDSIFARAYVEMYRSFEDIGQEHIDFVTDTGLIAGYSFDFIDRWIWSIL